MAVPMKVGHVGKQPTSLNGGLESVLQISMATQITPGFSQKCHATSKFTWLTLINRSLFWGEKIAHGTRRDRSLRLVRYANRESIYTHVNQMWNNCIFKTPNSLQEGPVSNLQTRCVRADEGRWMLFSKYKTILSLIIAFMIVGGS